MHCYSIGAVEADTKNMYLHRYYRNKNVSKTGKNAEDEII